MEMVPVYRQIAGARRAEVVKIKKILEFAYLVCLQGLFMTLYTGFFYITLF